MRLGSYQCNVVKDTLLHQIYSNAIIKERHRHRFEFNNHYLKEFEAKGMVFSGINRKISSWKLLNYLLTPGF